MLALKQRYTIVVVTHNMQQAARVSDRTAFLLAGRLIEYGDTRTLFTRPEQKLTAEVFAEDQLIDHLEVEIEERCVNLLALQQPLAGDLRFITAALKINNDLERVGDHAVNIAGSAVRLADQPLLKPLV